MTEGNIRRKILRFALPILAGYFFQQLYTTVDALIVGNYLDSDALAAVTSTASYTYLMIGFVDLPPERGLSLPATSAQAIGKALRKPSIPLLPSDFFSVFC